METWVSIGSQIVNLKQVYSATEITKYAITESQKIKRLKCVFNTIIKYMKRCTS